MAEDVRNILRDTIQPDEESFGEAVSMFADRANTSTRTIYRVLGGSAGEATDPPSLMLSLADRLVTAAGRHLSETHAVIDGGTIVHYLDAP